MKMTYVGILKLKEVWKEGWGHVVVQEACSLWKNCKSCI